MTSRNSNLSQAKRNKNDEFYTQLSDIEAELYHYREHFKGKTVYCNCDDPRMSNFFKYFHMNFKFLGLKKLIATCYKTLDDVNYTTLDTDKGLVLEYTGEPDDSNMPRDISVDVRELEGDGDFRSQESINLLKEADIVVTNPPFSLFREYVAQLIEYDKQFLIIGSSNAITYKEIFPLLKDNKMWLGRHNVKEFMQPDGSIKKFGNIGWYTNLDHNKRHEDVLLFRKYNEQDYPKYDNYDAIEVNRVANIPVDYDGVMGVPISFMNRYNPEQFEIIGQGQGNLYRLLVDEGLSQQFVDDYYEHGGKGSIKANHPVLGYYTVDGVPVIPYMRILIKKRNKGAIVNHDKTEQ